MGSIDTPPNTQLEDTMSIPESNAVPENVEGERRIPCEVFSRIVGYIRPIQNWHQGKQQEFKERMTFRVPDQVLGEE